MDSSNRSSQQDEVLQETAARLIDALGIDSAIFICRSNYWHGILRLILERMERPQLVVVGPGRHAKHDRAQIPPHRSRSWQESWSDLPVAA